MGFSSGCLTGSLEPGIRTRTNTCASANARPAAAYGSSSQLLSAAAAAAGGLSSTASLRGRNESPLKGRWGSG
ncbi:hypothetical protein ColTof4_05905 [Colletotrichum tofieldiae]|nr:hypothetical protein ColTof3_01080 [Colletotrichum tofieldiae]GKT73482.1 hypothetical protein ColTof4_05905 [Colletotrichum tofieldiae]